MVVAETDDFGAPHTLMDTHGCFVLGHNATGSSRIDKQSSMLRNPPYPRGLGPRMVRLHGPVSALHFSRACPPQPPMPPVLFSHCPMLPGPWAFSKGVVRGMGWTPTHRLIFGPIRMEDTALNATTPPQKETQHTRSHDKSHKLEEAWQEHDMVHQITCRISFFEQSARTPHTLSRLQETATEAGC